MQFVQAEIIELIVNVLQVFRVTQGAFVKEVMIMFCMLSFTHIIIHPF